MPANYGDSSGCGGSRAIEPSKPGHAWSSTAARELRDRWLEKVNANPDAPGLMSQGKYDVSRCLNEPVPRQLPLLIEQTAIAA